MSVRMPAPAAARRSPHSPGRYSPGLLCLVLAGLLWGTGGLTGSLLGRTAGLPAMAVAAYRLTAGGALLVVFLTATGRRWPAGRAAWTRVAAVGLLAALFQSCYFGAVALTSVSLATLITIGSAPVIVQAASRLLRRPSHSRPATTCLALAGLALLVGVPTGGVRESAVLASAGLAVLAASGFAALTLLGEKPVAGLDELSTIGFGFLGGGAVLMTVAAVTSGVSFAPHLEVIGLIIALGTGPTAVAYTLYFRGLRTASASTGALLSLLEPLTATVLAVLLLGNRLSAAGVAGALLLGLAVMMTARGHRALGEVEPVS
jgi:drug/metabolite transporter, DME family